MQPAPDGSGGGLAVVRRAGERVTLERTVPLPPPRAGGGAEAGFGLALTHDDAVLVMATRDHLRFYDVARLTSGTGDALLGDLSPADARPGYFHVAVTSDDGLLFVSNHNEEWISVVDLAAARRASFRTIPLIGRIPVGYGPDSVVLSNDGRYLYATSQIAVETWKWPLACRPPNQPPGTPFNHEVGAVHVIDVARAATNPERAVLSTTKAGCDTVRLAISPTDARVYVTARGDDELLVFDAQRLLADSTSAPLDRIKTHAGPIGVVAFNDGRRIAVANGIRATGVADEEVVAVIDALLVGAGRSPVLGSGSYGGGHVDLALTPDGTTLLIPNFEPRSLTLLPVSFLKFE
jgi:DNA-binding beta-propeller fold protein YncE